MTAPAAPTAWELPGGRYVVPGNRADLLDGLEPAESPAVSVVVPYYRQQRSLDLVLAGLSVQTHPATRLEVVVADDGSPEPPDVGALDSAIPVTVLRQRNRGFRAAAARNLAARAAGGTVLCFLDGDTVPEPDYVGTLARLPALLPEAIVTGRRRHADLDGWPPERVRRWLTGLDGPPVELPEPGWLTDLHRRSNGLRRLDRRSYEAVLSAVLGVSAALFAEIGGFDETFRSYGGEDWEFGYRALNAGAVLAHEPAAVAWHDGPDWAIRSAADAAAARAGKQRETAELAARIPGVGSPLPGAGRPPPDAVLHLDGPPVGARAAAAAYRADPDLDCVVVQEPETPDPVDLDRCRAQLWVRGDEEFPTPSELRDLVVRVAPGGFGRSTLIAPGRWRAAAVASPALRRTARWADALPYADSLAELFGAEERVRSPAGCGQGS